jgi:hypothetical protein
MIPTISNTGSNRISLRAIYLVIGFLEERDARLGFPLSQGRGARRRPCKHH